MGVKNLYLNTMLDYYEYIKIHEIMFTGDFLINTTHKWK